MAQAWPDLGGTARVCRLPRRTREDKGSRLTLSPAVPPDWMHSIQSPRGQITQTPVSVTCRPQTASGMLALPVWVFSRPLASENRGVEAGSRGMSAPQGKGKGRGTCSPLTASFPETPAGPSHQRPCPLTPHSGEGTFAYLSLKQGSVYLFWEVFWQYLQSSHPLTRKFHLQKATLRKYPEFAEIYVQGHLRLFIITEQWKQPKGPTRRN